MSETDTDETIPPQFREDIRKFEELIGMSFAEFDALEIEEQMSIIAQHFTRVPSPKQMN